MLIYQSRQRTQKRALHCIASSNLSLQSCVQPHVHNKLRYLTAADTVQLCLWLLLALVLTVQSEVQVLALPVSCQCDKVSGYCNPAEEIRQLDSQI